MPDIDEPALPVDVADAALTADRRRADGSRTLWIATEQAHRASLARWDLIAGQWLLTTESAGESWIDILVRAHDPDVTRVRPDEITDYRPQATTPLLEMLVCDGHADLEGVDWPDHLQEHLLDDDDFAVEDGVIRRHAKVGDKRLYFAESGSVPVAFLADADDIVGDPLVTFCSGSESGMTSGAGGWTLTQVSPGTSVTFPHGDTAGSGSGAARGFRHDATPAGTAALIAAWLEHTVPHSNGIEGCLAVALEPLDPQGMLTELQRAEWHGLLDGLRGPFGETLYATVQMSGDTLAAVRRALAVQDSTYAAVASALANPVAGDWFRAALADGDRSPLW